jgi:radical SAM superfamily enzyme YgiQ (UPF0313 family)
MNILLVSPRTPSTFWSFSHVLPFISKKAAFPPLGLLTVAAMLPRAWNLKLVDMNVSGLTDAQLDWADCVFLSAMIVHADSARRVIARCNARGKPVVAGGPLFTTGHERFPEVRHFVLGEAEDVMPALVADLEAGRVKHIYQSAVRPDVTRTPVPRWDLLNLRQYATMPLQFSRGCPFDCEFCDIIAMYGRVPRVKTPPQMIAELESLISAGWDGAIFIVDDNFIGNRVKVKALLRALVEWRRRRSVRVTFLTEASLNLVDDRELLELMVQAGFKRVFLGIESPQDESLAECAKVQNRRRDLIAAVRTIHNAGIEVRGGFIVGFDSDKSTIFEQQRSFIQESGVVTAMVGLLTALPGTRLFSRLMSEGRLIGHSTGNNLDAVLNYVPKLDRQTLIDGYRRLVRYLYTPRNYYDRILAFLRDYRPSGPPIAVRAHELLAFCRSLWVMGVVERGRREFWRFLTRTLRHHRRAFTEAVSLAIMGYHFRKVAASL